MTKNTYGVCFSNCNYLQARHPEISFGMVEIALLW